MNFLPEPRPRNTTSQLLLENLFEIFNKLFLIDFCGITSSSSIRPILFSDSEIFLMPQDA